MAAAYQPDAWFDFYVASAGVCAALWGLVFVAISLHPSHIGRHPVLRNRARLTLVGLCFQLVIALICLIPRQSPLVLGLELVLLGVLWIGILSAGLVRVTCSLGRVPRDAGLRTGAAILIGTSVLVAGATLGLGHGGGLYWNVVASVVGLVLTLANAWNISFGPELQDESQARATASTSAARTTDPVPALEEPNPNPLPS